MTATSIYEDIAARCKGDIYIGVVGPVRTGKSTFIKRFMETLVLPNITDPYDQKRTQDELPQSAAGKTVMTTEPKFIPDEAVEINLDEKARFRVKMIDCVGYLVPSAMGIEENGTTRMVQTPWASEPLSFPVAAELGTKKVIRDHAGIGLLLTTDGSFGEIPRSEYKEAESRVVAELNGAGKPFAIVLNSANPESESAISLAYQLEEAYGAPVALVNCLTIDEDDIRAILELILLEFPVTQIGVDVPDWVMALSAENWLRNALESAVLQAAKRIRKVSELERAFEELQNNESIENVQVSGIDLSRGKALVEIKLDDALFYRLVKEQSGFDIHTREDLLRLLCELSSIKKSYTRVAQALSDVTEHGYGIVTPEIEDLHLDEPEIIKGQGGYGVRLKASADSIHMIKARIETEINPIVGSEQQSEDLVNYLLREFDEDPTQIWRSNLFGKSLYELVGEGLHGKLENMPREARGKLSETLERIINEGSTGLICILL